MKKVLFFDQTLNQLMRIGNIISAHIKESTTEILTYGLVYDTAKDYTNPSQTSHSFDELLVTKQINTVREFIDDKQPDLVVLTTNTIPNQAVILFARKAGATVYMMQHGILYEGAHLNNVRAGEIVHALSEFKKTAGYFNILRYMCRDEHKSFINLLLSIVAKRKGVTTTIQHFFDVPLRGDKAFVIGTHWIDYYHDKYGYDRDDITVIGNHDLDGLDTTHPKEEAICYIPSVHVEDGHVSESVFTSFLKSLDKTIPNNIKLYVKLHPRSDIRLYRKNLHRTNIEYITQGELPYCTMYIGHNSTLLTRALHISGKVLLWRFQEEPELFYEPWAFAVCDQKENLRKNIESMIVANNVQTSNISKFSFFNRMGAYSFFAQKIVTFLQQT